MTSAALSTPPSLATLLCGLVGLMARGADGQLLIWGRSIGNGAKAAFHVPVQGAPEWIPGALLAHLQDDCWKLEATTALAVEKHPRSLAIVIATFRFQVVLRNAAGEEYGHGMRPVLPDEQILAAYERAAAFLAPTMIVDAGSVQTVLWALATPLDVSTPEAQALALALHARVATYLDAEPLPAGIAIAALRVPVPGSIIRDSPDKELVAVPLFNPDTTYTLADFDAALQRKATR